MRGFRKIISEMRLDHSRAGLVSVLSMVLVILLYAALIQ